MLRNLTGVVLLSAFFLSACNDDSHDNPDASGTGGNSAPAITGSPANVAIAGSSYSFMPTASDGNHDALTFSIQNKPAWASFSSKTGALTGRPSTSQVGVTSGIVISVSDGHMSASLAGFSISVTPAAASNGQTPTISGTPRTSVAVGSHYNFLPASSDPNGDALTFSIENKPSWATFDPDTGELSGVAPASAIGTFANIKISVSDGRSQAMLAPFSIAVNQMEMASATLSWTPPTQNVDGSALTNLAGYKIYYGRAANALDQMVEITNPGLTSYVLSNLSSSTWYFSIKAVTASKLESDFSAVVSAAI